MAPRWLTEGFRDGVDNQATIDMLDDVFGCWLSQFDETETACSGRLERFHFISRQRIRGALFAGAGWVDVGYEYYIDDDLIPQAEWDPRNGGIGCEVHHRPFDSHAGRRLLVPAVSLPSRVLDFIADYGLELEAERKFPDFEVHAVQELPTRGEQGV